MGWQLLPSWGNGRINWNWAQIGEQTREWWALNTIIKAKSRRDLLCGVWFCLACSPACVWRPALNWRRNACAGFPIPVDNHQLCKPLANTWRWGFITRLCACRLTMKSVLKQENLTLMPGKPQHEAVHGSLQAYGIMSKIGTGQSSAWLIKVNILIFFFLIMCVSVFFVSNCS